MVEPASRRSTTARASGRRAAASRAAEWLTLQPGAHEGYVDWERAEAIRRMVSENVPDEPASWRAQARRCVARWSRPLPPLRAQADRPLQRREAQHSTLCLPPRPARQWRAALHRLRRTCGSTTPSRPLCSRSSNQARSPRRSRPRRRRPAGSDQVREALLRDLGSGALRRRPRFPAIRRRRSREPPRGGGAGGALEQGARARRRGRGEDRRARRGTPLGRSRRFAVLRDAGR